jgi:peptide methionine sulfoxide reductase MsrB
MSSVPDGLSDGCKGAPLKPNQKLPIAGDESIMCAKSHGTSAAPVKASLRWGCDNKLADRICNFNRHYAEHSGYWLETNFLKQVNKSGETTFYDSVTGRPLFIAPRGRSWADFEKESRSHGWPSFRDAEVVWDDVRVLPDGECVSVSGTHLGHNLPDSKGNRYCINLVSVAAEAE